MAPPIWSFQFSTFAHSASGVTSRAVTEAWRSGLSNASDVRCGGASRWAGGLQTPRNHWHAQNHIRCLEWCNSSGYRQSNGLRQLKRAVDASDCPNTTLPVAHTSMGTSKNTSRKGKSRPHGLREQTRDWPCPTRNIHHIRNELNLWHLCCPQFALREDGLGYEQHVGSIRQGNINKVSGMGSEHASHREVVRVSERHVVGTLTVPSRPLRPWALHSAKVAHALRAPTANTVRFHVETRHDTQRCLRTLSAPREHHYGAA